MKDPTQGITEKLFLIRDDNMGLIHQAGPQAREKNAGRARVVNLQARSSPARKSA